MTIMHVEPYEPPRIVEQSSIEYPLVAVVSLEPTSAAFRSV